MKFNGKCAEMEQEGSSKQQVLEYKPAQNYSITEMVELSGVPPHYNPEPELAQLLYCCRRQYAQRKSREANNRASRHQNIPVVQALQRCEIVWPTGRRWMQGRPLPHINQRTVPYKEWTRIPCIAVIFQSATPDLVPDVPIATTQLEAGRKYQELLKVPQPKTKATHEMVHGFRLTTSNGLFQTIRMGNYKRSIYQQGKGKK